MIQGALSKSMIIQGGDKFKKPFLWHLPVTIQRLLKLANKIGPRSLKPAKRFHVDVFIEISMKECIVHVPLVQFPSLRSSNRLKTTNDFHFTYWSKSFVQIFAFDLSIAKNN